eukprot:12020068-Alexandrium_andersonii.AAC.1
MWAPSNGYLTRKHTQKRCSARIAQSADVTSMRTYVCHRLSSSLPSFEGFTPQPSLAARRALRRKGARGARRRRVGDPPKLGITRNGLRACLHSG